MPTYLIWNNNSISYFNNITDTIEYCTKQDNICSVYKLNGANGKYYNYYCDISKGILM